MSSSTRRELSELARLYGVLRSYDDVRGERRHASPEALFLTLRALGAELTSPADAPAALAARVAQLQAPGTDPVHVAWGGRLSHVHLRVPATFARSPAQLTLRLESGEVRTWKAPFEPVPRTRRRAGGWRLRVRGPLPIGYHELEVETRGTTFRTRIISSPRDAYSPSAECSWGVFAPLYAVRTRHDDGAGDLDDLATLAHWVGEHGGQYVGTLPLLAAFVRQPFEPSPYSPVSRLFWNEFYVPVMHGQTAVHRAVAGGLVDYRAVAATRRAALAHRAQEFFTQPAGEARSAFEQFLQSRPRLADYARFRAACDRFGRGWHAWPQRLRDGRLQEDDYERADELYYLYAQWLAEQHLAAIAAAADGGGASLYLDLPLGVNPDGYDAWRFRDIFCEGASAGAPPDTLFTGGQDWGFRPFEPERLRASGYSYLIEAVRHHLRHARMLRLDHVMSLFRLYWIPSGLSAQDGVYVQYQAHEMLAVLLTESARHHGRIVGEDLGTVPRAVRDAMQRHHVQRIYVVQYELVPGADAPLNQVPRNAVASVNTHDMPPFASFLEGGEVTDQLHLGLVDQQEAEQARQQRRELVASLHRHFDTEDGDPRALLQALLRHLAASDARTVLVNMEDLWLEHRPQNVPGTSHERPNWQRRFARSLEEIMTDPGILATLEEIDELRRGNPAPAFSNLE